MGRNLRCGILGNLGCQPPQEVGNPNSLLAFAFLILAAGCVTISPVTKHNYYTQGSSNRMVAEWEPATGTLVTWPLCLPYKLVIELSKNNMLFTLVENDSTKHEASKWYSKWGIDSSHVKFIVARQGIDAWWVRDWGPHAVFTANKVMKLGDGKYIYSTPVSDMACNSTLKFLYTTKENTIVTTDVDDAASKEIGKALNFEMIDLPFATTGGNIQSDGLGTAFSTCILNNENRFAGVNDSDFLTLNNKLLGISQYNIISNFEKRGIQHIDCFMKIIDEERILVLRPPVNHELYKIYEKIVTEELARLRTVYNRPYQILRIDSYPYEHNLLAAYTNSLILNKSVYVPLFGIPGDSIALKKWQEVMPGYTVKGFSFNLDEEPTLATKMKENYGRIGWSFADALHCRTRAIWDKDMLFITVKRLDPVVQSSQAKRVFATIIDYSKKGLIKNNEKVHWRIKGEPDWHYVMLKSGRNENQFFADIPSSNPGTTIEYYITCESKAGRKETMPRTAPTGYYSYFIANSKSVDSKSYRD